MMASPDEAAKSMDRYIRELRWQERTCVFIDNSNLFHALRTLNPEGTRLRQRRLNYIKLRDILADGRNAEFRFYYSAPMPPDPLDAEARMQWEKAKKFYDGIEQIGYTMIALPLRCRPSDDGLRQAVPKEKGLDCEIVYDMAVLSRMGGFRSFVLVSGDEDYARTVRKIRNETGIQVEVAFFSSAGCSSVLMKEASRFIDLGEYEDILLREYSPRTVAECLSA